MLKNHFVNILAITLVAFAIYTSPASHSSLVAAGISGNVNLAAASVALNNSAVSSQIRVLCPVNLVCTPIPPQPAGCPSGYTCIVAPLTVLSPNGGETWTKGQIQNISWKDYSVRPIPVCAVGYVCDAVVPSYDIKLMGPEAPCPNGYTCSSSSYVIAKGIDGTKRSYSWKVGALSDGNESISDGMYTVQICQSGTTICDSSDSSFKIITAPVPTVSEQVKCIFNGSTKAEKCYSNVALTMPTTTITTFSCTGIGSCVANISAPKGTQLFWNSSCGGVKLPITTTDGQSETVNFTCSAMPVVSNLGVTYGPLTISTSGSARQTFTFNASVTAGNYPMYISKDGPTAFPMVIGTTSLTIVPVGMTGTDSAGDSSLYYYIAPGQTKSFSVSYMASGSATSSMAYPQVYAINFGTSASNLTAAVLTDSSIPNTLKALLFH